MPRFQHFDVAQSDAVTELRLSDTSQFDVPRYSELQDELMAFVDMYRPLQLVIDFDRIRYCSTALIFGVLQARARLDEVGGRLKLCGMRDSVREAFSMLKLDGPLEIYASEADALAAF